MIYKRLIYLFSSGTTWVFSGKFPETSMIKKYQVSTPESKTYDSLDENGRVPLKKRGPFLKVLDSTFSLYILGIRLNNQRPLVILTVYLSLNVVVLHNFLETDTRLYISYHLT